MQDLLRLLQSADDFLNDVGTSDTEEDDAFEEFPAEGTTILFLRCVTRFFLALGPSID